MVDKSHKASWQRKATEAQIVGFPNKVEKSDRAQAAYPKIIAQKKKKTGDKEITIVDVIKRSETRLKKATKTLESNEVQLQTNK